MWWCDAEWGIIFHRAAQLSVPRLLSPTELACAICWNLSVPSSRACLGFWSHGLFVLITHRNKDRAEAVEGFGTISSPGQENKLTSIRGPVYLVFCLSPMQNLFLHFPLVEWQAWQYIRPAEDKLVCNSHAYIKKLKYAHIIWERHQTAPFFFFSENVPFVRSALDGHTDWASFFLERQ